MESLGKVLCEDFVQCYANVTEKVLKSSLGLNMFFLIKVYFYSSNLKIIIFLVSNLIKICHI